MINFSAIVHARLRPKSKNPRILCSRRPWKPESALHVQLKGESVTCPICLRLLRQLAFCGVLDISWPERLRAYFEVTSR